MTKNPFVNALAALCYITLVASVMFFGTKMAGQKDDTFLAPVAFISLFTLSASVMAYIFGYQPFQLYFDGKKKEALDLVLKTIAAFGVITTLILILLFSGTIK